MFIVETTAKILPPVTAMRVSSVPSIVLLSVSKKNPSNTGGFYRAGLHSIFELQLKHLGGGNSNIFWKFPPLIIWGKNSIPIEHWGGNSHLDEHIFQMGWLQPSKLVNLGPGHWCRGHCWDATPLAVCQGYTSRKRFFFRSSWRNVWVLMLFQGLFIHTRIRGWGGWETQQKPTF